MSLFWCQGRQLAVGLPRKSVWNEKDKPVRITACTHEPLSATVRSATYTPGHAQPGEEQPPRQIATCVRKRKWPETAEHRAGSSTPMIIHGRASNPGAPCVSRCEIVRSGGGFPMRTPCINSDGRAVWVISRFAYASRLRNEVECRPNGGSLSRVQTRKARPGPCRKSESARKTAESG
jgi:hypothetical protein